MEMFDIDDTDTPRVQMFKTNVEMFPAFLYKHVVEDIQDGSILQVTFINKNDETDKKTIEFVDPTFDERYTIFDVLELSIVKTGTDIGDEMH